MSHPIIDLALMKIPTYASATIGGFLFRMGLGALPFLLPLMLQVGFGLDPLSSGLLTFASAAGAMTMKMTAAQIIRTLGFRVVLVGDAVISALFLFGYSLFRPDTPHLRDLSRPAGGRIFPLVADDQHQHLELCRCAAGDAEPCDQPDEHGATAFANRRRRDRCVVLAADADAGAAGAALIAADFYPAFVGVAIISLLSVPFFLSDGAPDAGAEVSGRRSRGDHRAG